MVMSRVWFAVLFLSMSLVACKKETIIDEDKLPDEIKTFVSTHFPDKKILQSVKEFDDFSTSYRVILEGNYQLVFDHKKEIEEIEGIEKLPDSVIPVKILDYVSANYPANYIIKWNKEKTHQEVVLDNRLELEFNNDGDFLRIDN